MRTPLLSVAILVLPVSARSQTSNYPIGSTVANFITLDTEGHFHTLYDYTAQGRTVFLDFFLLHESGHNVSEGKTRITCQVRYFDMNDPTAIAHDWRGGWQEGGDFTKVHPDKVIQ